MLNLRDYPNMDLADLGSLPNTGYGAVKGVRAHCIAGGATALLATDITAWAPSFDIDDAGRFPATPFTIQAAYERMRVTEKTGNTLTVTRGYGATKAAAHKSNKTVFEVREEYVYLISEGPLKEIRGVSIDGRRQSGGFTAYTGKAGIEHPDWPGRAVVSFPAEAYIGRQRNLDAASAVSRESGESVSALIAGASDGAVADDSGTSHITISLTGRPHAQVFFGPGQGAIKKQTYTATVEDAATAWSASTAYVKGDFVVPTTENGYKYECTTAGTSGAVEPVWPTTPGLLVADGTAWWICREFLFVRAVIKDTSTGAVILNRAVYIPASTKVTFTLNQKGGAWETSFALLPHTGDIKVYGMGKTVVRERLPGAGESLVTYRPPVDGLSDDRLGDDTASFVTLSVSGRQMAWAGYDPAGLGEVDSQHHYAEVENASAVETAAVRLVSVDPDGAAYEITDHSLAPAATDVISQSHSGGKWETMTKLLIRGGQVKVKGLYKDVLYTTEEILQETALAATASARVVIGDDITVDADWAEDATGDYGGVGGLIERPDHVIRHFIVNRMGFTLEEIDEASFATAGASYATAILDGYRFGFVITKRQRPSELLRSLAFQCRSTIRYDRGKWRLYYVPDAAPPAIKTITGKELAGKGAMFTFNRTLMVDVANDLAVRYRRNYIPREKESDWQGVAIKSDSASQIKYGVYKKEFEFDAVRLEAMAEDVIDHILLQRKAPLLTVEFPVFYGHFDLGAGDTIALKNPLYDGRKFYIESIRRLDRFRAEVKAVEWWS